MNKSETIGALSAALAKAQAEMKNPHFDAVNPHFKSKFASLASVQEAVMPVLNRHGLALSQWPSAEDGMAGCMNLLSHSSGEWIENACALPLEKVNAHGAGSCITYARRYSMQSIAGVVADEDDDANASTKAKETLGKGVIAPSDGVEQHIPVERRESLFRMAATVTECVEAGQMKDAMDVLHDISDNEAKVYLWAQLDSKTRSAIKRAQKEAA